MSQPPPQDPQSPPPPPLPVHRLNYATPPDKMRSAMSIILKATGIMLLVLIGLALLAYGLCMAALHSIRG